MQFTGLLDKNGVEIYEGDILNYKKSGNNINIDTLYGKHVDEMEDYFGYSSIWMIQDSEVIGNIYENPELIENQNES
jgi:uncharacterized phage protein (TIGR01671 family)